MQSYWDSGQSDWQVAQTLIFGYLSDYKRCASNVLRLHYMIGAFGTKTFTIQSVLTERLSNLAEILLDSCRNTGLKTM